MEAEEYEPSGQIFSLLPKVMQKIGAIGKDKKNTFQGFNFRGIDDALNHCSPILADHGVSVSFAIADRQISRSTEGGKLKTYVDILADVTFYGPDGSSITNRLGGEGHDTGTDKAMNKAMAAAMKYGLFFGLVIPVDESSIEDSDRYGDPERGAKSKAAPQHQGSKRDWCKHVCDRLGKEAKCNKETAPAVVAWVSDGEITDPAVIKSDQAAAEKFSGMITKKINDGTPIGKFVETAKAHSAPV